MTEFVPTTEVHPLADGEVRLLGAVRQVTGAMTRVELGGKRILVDCGIAQGRESARFPEAARDIDAVVLTHGHQDHIGNLPTLLEGGFEKPIYATHATLEIAKISLEDSLSMQEVSDHDIGRFMARFNRLAVPLPYGVETQLPGARLMLHEAGHILGSASAELISSQSRIILSGDLGRPDSPLLQDPNTAWRAGKPVDVVVMEATYGAREHAHSHDDIEHDLEVILLAAIARKAKVLVPAFAIGRTQTLMYYIDKLITSGRVPELPVAIDTPMGLAITDTYRRFQKLFDKEALARLASGDDPLDFEDLFAVKRGRDSAKLQGLPGPMVIIAGSGMCTGGRIIRHLIEGLPHEDTTVLFVGYQAEGTPGRQIQEAAKHGGRVRLQHEEVQVRAQVATLKGLSAHADRNELWNWVSAIPKVRRVALHHGDVEAQETFAKWAAAHR
jgi:metallo-beta-lactamase family protein